MKVDFNNSSDPITRQIQTEPPVHGSASGAGSTAGSPRAGHGVDSSNVSVSLSSAAQTYAGVLQGLPDVRQARVQALTQQVQSGTYTVDNHQLGEAMANDLFGAAYAAGK
ncbi:MAG: flagellar biosynthesis anti-sigma factor FlgM [Terriglobia bacterium]